MGYAGQSLALGIIGVVVLALGVRFFGRPSLIPVAYLLQLSGPILIFMALAYSENAWADGSLGGVVSGILALSFPLLVVTYSLKKDPVLGSLQAALSFLSLFLFLDRALGLSMEESLWVMDGIGLLGLAWLGYRLRDPAVPDWTLNTFLAFLYVSLFLVFVSGEVIWELEAMVMVPADLWLLAVVGFSVWALQDGVPMHLQRDWYERQLAYCLLMAIPFTFITVLETLHLGANSAALALVAMGGVALWYSIRRGLRWILVTSCLILLIAAWYYGAEKAGALGSVLALTVMAVLLFILSSKLGSRHPSPVEPMRDL
jgi:hypothetical protein